MSDDATTAIEHLHTWLEGWEIRVPERPARQGLAWRRDGLGAVYARLEQLKGYDEFLSELLVEAQTKLAHCRAWKGIVRQQVEDVIGPNIVQSSAQMVQRGMAAEERLIAHRTKAAVPWSQQRSLERIEDMLLGAVEALRTRVFSERDERNDLRAQLRAINVGIEIGEL